MSEEAECIEICVRVCVCVCVRACACVCSPVFEVVILVRIKIVSILMEFNRRF